MVKVSHFCFKKMSVFFINENMHQIKQKNPRDAEHTQWRLDKQHNIEMMRV